MDNYSKCQKCLYQGERWVSFQHTLIKRLNIELLGASVVPLRGHLMFLGKIRPQNITLSESDPTRAI